MRSNSRKFIACFICGREEEVAEESRALLCSYCVMGGKSFPSIDERKEKRKQEKAAKKADKELSGDGKSKKKRSSSRKSGRPGNNLVEGEK